MKKKILIFFLFSFPSLINSQVLKTVKSFSDDVLELVYKKIDLKKKAIKIIKVSPELEKWSINNDFTLVANESSIKIYSKSGEILGTITTKGNKQIITTFSLISKKTVNPLLNSELFPSSIYKVDSTIYKTDRLKRVLTAKSSTIKGYSLKNSNSLKETYEPAINSIEKTGETKSIDQRAYLIAHFLGGNSGNINVVAKIGNLNLNEYKWIEEMIGRNKNFIKDYQVDAIYEGISIKPFAFKQKFEFRGNLKELQKEQIRNPTLKYILKKDTTGNNFYQCIVYHIYR